MERAWQLKEIDGTAVARLAQALALHPATARCLVARGHLDPDRVGSFLRPRLADLRRPDGEGGIAGFDTAVERLLAALAGGERIGIFGDYDVDGVTSTALLTLFLRAVGGDVVPRVARRSAGYGFGVADAQDFVARGCRLIVTCDCGTSDLPAIGTARAAGVDVIVLDHHQVPAGGLHPAVALINPHRADSRYPYRGFASVGLGFMLAAALRTRLRAAGAFASRQEPDVRELLDLVAVGTIADMAPLTDENRALVVAGLAKLSERRRPGLAALLERAEVQRSKQILDAVDVSFKIGPRLNAPGRLGDADPALALLLARDPVQAAAEALLCEEANLRRRELQDQVASEALADAEAQAHRAAIVVAREGWHPGVVGIVAAKLVERYGRPAAVVALDAATGEGRGSVRTAGGVDVYRALSGCADVLVRYGGHAAAAGLTVARDNVDALGEAFAAQVEGAGGAGARTVEIDAEVVIGDVDERLARELGALAPFGPGNAAPVLRTRARVVESRRVGDGSHLKMTVACPRSGRQVGAIGFGLGAADPGAGAAIDVAFAPEVSEFRGERRVEMKLVAVRPSASA